MSTAALSARLSLVPDDMGPEIITVSEAMLDAIADADRYAVQGFPVLLVGETGTGKELVARRIHARSGRRGELVPVNCAELRPEQAANLLFGHKKGAFTGASESTTGFVRRSLRGTLFLDEVTSLPLESQPTLLRFLETGEVTPFGDDKAVCVDIRVVAAAQPTIRQMLASGTARLDLFERLAVSTVVLPPLRDRPNDIVPLAIAFALQSGARLEPMAATRLLDHSWPGNVRELKSTLLGAAAIAADGCIGVAELVRAMASRLAIKAGPDREPQWEQERQALQALVAQADGDSRRLMQLLGVSRSTMYRRLADFGLSIRDGRQSHFVSGIPETE